MGERTWPNLLVTLLRGEELSTEDTAWAMAEIVAGEATPVQIAAFAVALRAKGETPAEIAGLVEAMLAAAARVDLGEVLGAESARDAVDVVGTGGDRAHTVNISTMAAIVVAAAGVRVVKHGNRAASSSCGAADLLEQLGVPLDLGPAEVARCVADAGIGFCFAPRFHSGLRHAAVPRREMGDPDGVQLPWPADQPGPAARGGRRMRRPAHGRHHGRGLRPAGRLGPRDAGRGRSGRVHDDGTDAVVGGRRVARCANCWSTRRISACRGLRRPT